MSSQLGINEPIGIKIIQKSSECCCPRVGLLNRDLWFRGSILVLTFLTYTCYHATRKTVSVVKTALNTNCSGHIPPTGIDIHNNSHWCDWAPFDGPDASTLLGTMDSAFLFAYAGAMFISGLVAERVSLRYFLAIGMILSGFASYLLGLAHTYHIHAFHYFIIVQVFGGICQTTGWPGVVAVMGNWFGKSKRGLIFGIWNSHTSVGNIMGTLIASYYLDIDWGLSFIVPGLIMGIMGFIVFLFLVPHPSDVGCTAAPKPPPSKKTTGYQRISQSEPDSTLIDMPDDEEEETAGRSPIASDSDLLQDEDLMRRDNEDRPILLPTNNDEAIGFLGALAIPGVIEFSLCLFFAKLVCYTFLYWLPLYIKTSTTLSATLSAEVSTLFDVGGIAGGIVAGILSDYSGMSATTCAGMLLLAVPMLFVYYLFGAVSVWLNICLLLTSGALVNGPYALITTAVSAELGTHYSLAGNAKALATVTAIIDGTGSIGAAVGPLLAGVVSNFGWEKVFYMLMVSDVCAMIFLSRLVKNEVQRCWR